jgi:DNA uptake protein ComE-like DNA-binding protein
MTNGLRRIHISSGARHFISLGARHFESAGHLEESGTVLIIVLWIAMGLITVALLFGESMMLEYRAADNSLAGQEATQAIEGAERYVGFILKNIEEAGTMPDIESYKADRVAVGEATFWLIGREETGQPNRTPVYGLVDEASKLNLNTATLEMLEALPRMTPELAAAIIDWRDTDEEVTPGGAESEVYLLQNPKYQCKNSRFETIEELRLVVGMNEEILNGEDSNRNGVLDTNENDGDASLPDDSRDGLLNPGLLEYVTVYSREPNKDQDGAKRINVRNAQDENLAELLRTTFGADRAGQIQESVRAQAPVNSVLEYYYRSGMTAEEFSQISDKLTASDDDFVEGLVNVNTASSAVLACIPGIGTAYADKLVSYRQGQTDQLDTTAWVKDVLDEESAIQAGPYITTRSYQFEADVAAVGRNGRGFSREVFILDTSGDEPVVAYRRDQGRLGWPLGVDLHSELLSSTREGRTL